MCGAAPVYMLAAWLMMVKGQVASCLVFFYYYYCVLPNYIPKAQAFAEACAELLRSFCAGFCGVVFFGDSGSCFAEGFCGDVCGMEASAELLRRLLRDGFLRGSGSIGFCRASAVYLGQEYN